MSAIDEAVVMAQRGYDRGVADRATSGGAMVERTLRKVDNVLIDAGVAVRSPDGWGELVEAAHRLAEEAGHLLALAEPAPSGPPGQPRALTLLLHLDGRAKALQVQIAAIAAEAKDCGASWLQIGRTLGITKEEAFSRFGTHE